jgi:hypothetical protein
VPDLLRGGRGRTLAWSAQPAELSQTGGCSPNGQKAPVQSSPASRQTMESATPTGRSPDTYVVRCDNRRLIACGEREEKADG